MHQQFPFYCPPNTQIGIFGLKKYHLATLAVRTFGKFQFSILAKMISTHIIDGNFGHMQF
jgi:hypothetical protein